MRACSRGTVRLHGTTSDPPTEEGLKSNSTKFKRNIMYMKLMDKNFTGCLSFNFWRLYTIRGVL